MIHVEPLTAELEQDYRALLLADPAAMVYATPEYRAFLQTVVPGQACYLAALQDGRLAGVLPLFRIDDRQHGSVLNSLPWYGSHGGCVLAPGADDGVRFALLERYRELAAAPDVLSATIVLTPDETAHAENYRRVLQPAAEDARTGQITPLPEPGPDLEGRLERTFAQKTRNLARKARRQGFVLAEDDGDEAWDFLHGTHAANLAALGGRAKPRSHFEALRSVLPATMRRLLLAQLHGRTVAALLLLYHHRTVEYFTPVIEHDYRPLQPLSFLIWHGMADAVDRGFRWWNWGGTWASQTSLHHFKAGWGAIDRPYSYLISATAEGRRRMRAAKAVLAERFPYYYTFPYAMLEDGHA